MPSHPTLTVITLGGGVQSSVSALVASRGEYDRVPGCAIFADSHGAAPAYAADATGQGGRARRGEGHSVV